MADHLKAGTKVMILSGYRPGEGAPIASKPGELARVLCAVIVRGQLAGYHLELCESKLDERGRYHPVREAVPPTAFMLVNG